MSFDFEGYTPILWPNGAVAGWKYSGDDQDMKVHRGYSSPQEQPRGIEAPTDFQPTRNGEPIPMMSVEEFRAKGYLQELNRRFLHPLGLALCVVVDDNGTEFFGGVWKTDDPEGIVFEISADELPEIKSRANAVADEFLDKTRVRARKLKYEYGIQPIRVTE